MDERYLMLAVRYVELNPIRAKLCRVPWRLRWSSAAGHVDEKAESDVLNLSWWYDMISAGRWRKELEAGLSDSELGRVRLSTHTGRPLGSDSFLCKLEKLIGRRVRPLPVGRPRKEKAKKAYKRKKTNTK
jgi:putative transposase